MDTIRDMEAEDDASIVPVIWAVYTEHDWPNQLDGTPTAGEWKALRRWARGWIRRKGVLRQAAIDRWATLDSMTTDDIRQLADFATQPDDRGWPSNTLRPPDTPEETLLLKLALCMRPQQWIA